MCQTADSKSKANKIAFIYHKVGDLLTQVKCEKYAEENIVKQEEASYNEEQPPIKRARQDSGQDSICWSWSAQYAQLWLLSYEK